MAFVTYILLSTLLAGLRGAFHPEVMGLTATAAFAVVAVEILGLKFGTYLLSISNESQLLDLVAYSGYKFVGVIVTLVVAEILNGGRGTGGWAGWTIFTYTFLANAFFLVSDGTESKILPPFITKKDKLIIKSASIFEILASARLLIGELLLLRWQHADRCPRSEESTDAISLSLRVHCSIRLYVGPDPSRWR